MANSSISRYVIGFIGREIKGGFDIIYYAFWKTMLLTNMMIISVIMLLTGQVSTAQIMGPIGIAKVIGETSVWADLVNLTAFISLNLGIVNLIPFPPLDGSKIIFFGIEAVRRKPLKPEKEAVIQLIGFAVLIILIIFVSFNDVKRTF
jgi:regulator of sigma E protease